MVEPGVEQPGESVPPLPLKGLLRSKFWLHHFYQPEDHEWQPTLFEPVGGMDKIVQAFEKKLEEDRVRITRNAQVVRVENSNDGVRVFYRDSRTGLEKRTSADYCISNIPLPLLRSIISNDTFDRKYKSAVSAVRFADSCKVAWQSERFWESREDQIYGGISWINHPITQMWYPSAGYFATKGSVDGRLQLFADRPGIRQSESVPKIGSRTGGCRAAASSVPPVRGYQPWTVDRLAGSALPGRRLGRLGLDKVRRQGRLPKAA